MTLLVQKNWGEIYFCQKCVFGNFKTLKKVVMTTKLEGGGGVKTLVVGPLKKTHFLLLPIPRSGTNLRDET